MQRVAKIYLKEVATLRGKKKKKFCKEKVLYFEFWPVFDPEPFFFFFNSKKDLGAFAISWGARLKTDWYSHMGIAPMQ